MATVAVVAGPTAVVAGALIGGAISGGVSAVSQYATEGKVDWKVVGIDTAAGMISGAFAATPIGLTTSVAINGTLGVASYVGQQAVKNEKIDIMDATISGISGMIAGTIAGEGVNGKQLTNNYKVATNSIKREARRANQKYAAKKIAQEVATTKAIKATASKATKAKLAGVIAGAIYNIFVGKKK